MRVLQKSDIWLIDLGDVADEDKPALAYDGYKILESVPTSALRSILQDMIRDLCSCPYLDCCHRNIVRDRFAVLFKDEVKKE